MNDWQVAILSKLDDITRKVEDLNNQVISTMQRLERLEEATPRNTWSGKEAEQLLRDAQKQRLERSKEDRNIVYAGGTPSWIFDESAPRCPYH